MTVRSTSTTSRRTLVMAAVFAGMMAVTQAQAASRRMAPAAHRAMAANARSVGVAVVAAAVKGEMRRVGPAQRAARRSRDLSQGRACHDLACLSKVGLRSFTSSTVLNFL